jgi:hypothetical protein
MNANMETLHSRIAMPGITTLDRTLAARFGM